MRHLFLAFRSLRAEKSFALTAAFTLALGVATITTTISIADAELWKPLPYPAPDRLVAVFSKGPGARAQVDPISGADLLDWRRDATTFSDIAAMGRTSRRVMRVSAGSKDPASATTPAATATDPASIRIDAASAESVLVSEVTANYFATLGRGPIAGRTFGPEDARSSTAAVLSDRAWRRLFAADQAVIGKVVTVDDKSFTIAGIVAFGEAVGLDADVYLPIDESAATFLDRSALLTSGAIGRMRPGVDAIVARAQVQAIATRIATAFPEGRTGHAIFIEDLASWYLPDNTRPLYYFVGASLVVLLLATVNVATLLLGRAVRRTREFALRGALGGNVRALIRQLLAEAAVIAVPGGALGVLLAAWVLRTVTSDLLSDFLQRGTTIPIDLRVCAFALLLTAVTTIVCTMVPLVLTRRIDLSSVLAGGSRVGRSAGEGRARMALLTAQIALTVVLLSAAGIFMKSFMKLTHVPLGFDPVGAVAVRATLSGPRYATDAQVRQYATEILEKTRAIPGITEAAVGSSSPLGSGPLIRFVATLGGPNRLRQGFGESAVASAKAEGPPYNLQQTGPPYNLPQTGPAYNLPADAPRAILRAITPGYFHTLGMNLIKGRDITDADVAGAPRVAVVNEHLASAVFAGENPVGKIIDLLPGARVPWTNRPGPVLIVGVVADVKEVGINEVGFSGVFVPFAQAPAPTVELDLRSAIPMTTLVGQVRKAAASIDPAIPVTSVSTFESRVARALQTDRFNFLLTVTFAVVAVFLAGIGIYGAVAYAVESRTREFGVRLAFGARTWMLVGSALWQAGRVGAIGGVVGLGVTLALARLLGDALYLVPGSHNGLLYGVTTTDPIMLGSAVAGVILVALAAGAAPARRVTRLDPVVALRGE